MNKILSNKRLPYIILVLIIVTGICRFSYGFFVQKVAYHSDESWSFGLANSYYKPYLAFSDDTSELTNEDEWISSDAFVDYLTVQEGERFSFRSVYHNLSYDNHPPLYFFILNFLCSFFPNQYIPALGFLINMIAYIITAIYMYKLLMLMTKSRAASLIGTLFATFSLAMLCMTMFVRMYMMCATLALILTYINAKIYYVEESRHKKSTFISLGIVSLLGALTDSFFLPYAFAISLAMFISMLVKKEWRLLLRYSITMLLSVAISIVIFPSTVLKMFGFLSSQAPTDAASDTASATSYVSSSTRDMPIYFQFKSAFILINTELFGFRLLTPLYTNIPTYILCGILVVSIIVLAFSFVARKEEWFITLKGNIWHGLKRLPKWLHANFNYFIFGLVASIVLICFVVACIVDVYGLDRFADRYLMVCFPAVIVIYVFILWKLFTFIFRKRKIIGVALLIVSLTASVISSQVRIGCHYFMKYDYNVQLETIAKDSNFIVVSAASWFLMPYSAKLYGCNDVFFTTYWRLDDCIDKIEDHELEGDTYLIIGTALFDDTDQVGALPSLENTSEYEYSLSSTFKKCYDMSIVDSISYVGHDNINGFYFEIYKIN